MVELYPEDYDRLEFYDFLADDLVDPDLGISVGNKVKYSLSITNTIDIAPLPDDLGAAYRYQYNDKQLRSSAFSYDLSITNTVELHENLDRYTTTTDWEYVDGGSEADWGDFGHTWHKAEPVYINRTVQHPDGVPFEVAGINQSVPLYLLEGWAVPSQNCILGICTIWTDRGTENFNLGSGLKFDVFPVTLDEFYTLTSKDGGYALAWSQSGDVTFPRLVDGDGDGIPYPVDAHDNVWDNDGDGLSDSFEVKLGSNPDNKDSDGDGLPDNLELISETNPLRTDSDGDGLSDGAEVYHQDITDHDSDGNFTEWLGGWEYGYNLKPDGTLQTTWVSSSPMSTDSDGDSLTDFQEKTFGFNPTWMSNPTILTFESTISESDGSGGYTDSDGFALPGDTLYYAASVENELYNRWAHGLLDTDFPGVLDDDAIDPQPFLLYPLEQQVIEGQVPVANTAASGVYNLTQTAGALISDWAELASGAALWYPFEDDAAATTYADRSGSIPPDDGTCSNATPGAGCVPIKNDGVYGGSLNFDGTARVASDYDPADNAFAISLWFKTTEPNGGLLDTQGFWDRWLYLYGGNVKARMYNGVSHQILTSAQTYNDGDWHHVVHTFGGSAGGQKLYVDGQRVDSGSYTTARASTNGIRLGYANISGIGYFDGKIDDVRLFERGLTFTEVQAIFDTPILDLRFNESSGWQDSSPFANDASCTGTCPDHVDGIDGRGANFSGSHYITVPSDDSLKLNQGGFTIGVWIYPTESPEYCYQREFYSPPCDIWKPQPQGILGFGSGEDNAYPTLQRVGNALRFTYGDKPYFTTGDVLQPNKWNHVAVSYDGSAVLIYVNGVKVAEDSTTFTTPPPGTKTLTVGRSGTAGTFEVKKVRVDEEGDGIGKAEMCIAFRSYGGDWQTVFDQQVDGGLVDASYFPLLYNVAAGPFEFNTLADLRVWEDDGGEHCVTVNNKSDSDPIDDGDDGMGFWSFRTTDVSKGFDKLYSTDPTTDPYRHYGLMGYSGDSSGHFYMVYHNDSIPFYGKIDELLIYNRPFDADSVLDMYQAQRLSLHLKFDDPPGETSFVDSSFGHHNASCGGAACPVAGVAGRVNQAAIFDGNDHLTLANSGINRLTNEFSVAAWIRPESVSGYHRILSTARTNSHNGFAFGTYNDGLSFTTFGKKDYALTGLGLVTGKWTHVAAVMDENNAVSFYVNGVFQDIVAGSSPASADTDDALLVGATTDSGSSVRIQTFNGRIDDLYVFSNALSEAGILNLYQNAPAFQLHLDETQSATGFSDDANPSRMVSCTGSHCPQVGFGVDGQLGTAAQFDGVDDYIYTPYSQQTTGDFSISAWVRPTAIRDGQQPIFVHYATSYANFGLFIKPDSMIPQFLAHGCAGGSETVLDSGSALIMNSWNHIVGTYSGGTMTIYINGAPQGSQNWNRCQNPGPFWVGGNVPDTVPFAGQLDEVTLYNHALSRQMIAEIFNYQGKWVQERQSHNIAIDDDNPTVTLETTGDRLPDTDVQMLVIASDPTSGIQSVQFGVQAPGQSSYTWSDAPPCQDAAAETAWCPTFNPAGEGAYSLRAKVTDLVGHISTTDATVYVDNQSPTATFDFTANALLLPTLSDTQPNTWELALSGMISDPDIGSEAGSGVAASSLQVSVFNENGTLVGPAPQPPTLNGDNWSLDYDIAEPYPSGIFTVTLTATDKIVLRAGLDDSQLDRHSLETSRLIQIDATPAAGYLDLGGVTALITDTQTLEGQATERPVHLRVAWNTDAHADQLGLAITCNGLIQHQFQPGTLQPLADSYSWSGDVHRGAACQIHLTDTGGDGGTSGTIEACGEEIADWDASFGGGQVVNFTAVADACGPSLDVAGVAGVETALVSVLPGSPFYNQEPIPGATLHLPFDDVPTANGTLSFRDISGENRNGTCTGIACPTWGQPGHVGRAVSFSGAQWIDSTNFDIDDDFTLSLWINPLATSDGQSFIGKHTYGGSNLIVFGFWNGGYSFRIRSDSYDAGTKTTGWQHLVVVGQKTSATTTLVTVYKDNQLLWQHTLNAVVGNVSGKPWSFGQEWDGNTRSDYFSGLMDEARFFDRAMDAAEISELNMGANPVLHLPLDESWASNGTALPDQSGWAHDGWLSAGIGDMVNKAAPGGVGPYALDFDGSDDHITIPDSNALDLEQFSVGLWVRPDTWSYSVDNPLILKGNQSGNNLNYGIYITAQGKLSFRFYDASCTTLHAVEDGVAPLHQWSHILATYDGTQVSIYRNGQVVKTEAVSGGVCQNNDPVWIGETPGGVTTYEGLIDDVILYPRVISEPEVESLYAAGWQSTTTTPTGVGVELSDWNTSIPAGLEGTFRLDLRGEDMNALVSKPEAAWQGEIDTLDPRVTLDAQVSGDTVQYTTIAADWNLTESGYNTPCGAGIIDQREYFESPWYQALGTGEQRVYQLTTQCEHSIAELSGEVGAYDTPGLSYGVAVSSTLSYIADGEGGLQIVDVSNPVQPQFVGSLGGIYPWAVAVAPGGAVLIPDLMVDSIAVEPASPEINQAFIVSVTVRNQGAGTAWNFTTAIYQDAQPAACEGSIPQWTAAIPRLDAGQSAVVAFSHSGFSSFTPHTLYAQADSGCMVAESDEANNIAGPLYITAVQSDLVVESLSFDPVSPFENQPFTITAVISNTGTGAAATFSTTIYIDQAIGFTDCNVPGWATMSVSSLAAGTSTEVVFNHSGLSATGDYEVIAYADSGCDVAESQELNNLAGDWVTVVTAPKPDLLITLITSETNSPIINQPFVVTTTVHNQGTAASGAFTTTVFLDEQPLACPNLTGQFDATRITNLDPGESATITFTHPGISTYGGHFITSQADSHCEVIESIETNNTSTRLNLNVVDPNKPDLTIENIVTHPITPTINQSFIISVTLKNQGLGIAVDFYGYIMTAIYQDKVPSNCDEGTLWIYTGPLNPGETRIITRTLAGISTPGPHQFYANVDSACEISESNEDNNIFGPITVTARAPDLIVEEIATQPITPTINQSLVVSVTIKNQGLEAAQNFDTTFYFDHIPSQCDEGAPDWYFAHTDYLTAGVSTVVTMTYPGFNSTGTHQIYAQADGACQVTEADEDNNIYGPHDVTVSSSGPAPDLIIEALDTQPAAPGVNQPFSITVLVKNQGLLGTGSFDTGVFINEQPTGGCHDIPWDYQMISLAAGISTTLTFEHPGLIEGGPNDIYAMADVWCTEIESNESNNIFGPITIDVAALDGNRRQSYAGDFAWPGKPLLAVFSRLVFRPGSGQPVAGQVEPSMQASTPTLTSVYTYTYAYIADVSYGLRIVDVSDPASPAQVGALPLPGPMRNIVVAGDYAYLVSQFNGLFVVDISNPGYPGLLDSYATPGHTEGLDVSGGYAYVADRLAGLQVIDVSDPNALQWKAVYNTPGYAYGVDMVGGYAYVADGSGGLQVLDISNPSSPQFVGELDSIYAVDIDVNGNTAYIVTGSQGLAVVDISDPANPELERWFNTPGYAQDVVFSGELAYIADQDSGLRVINPTEHIPEATACDTAGHCTTVEMTHSAADLVQVALDRNPQAEIHFPLAAPPLSVEILNLPSVLDSTAPFTITGHATSTLTTLELITVTVDGTALMVTGWVSGTQESDWNAGWTPAGDGPHLVRADVLGAYGSTASETVTVTVDTLAPTVNISPTVYTSADYYEPRTINLRGEYADAGGVASVEWRVADGEWRVASGEWRVAGGEWRGGWSLDAGPLPDNETFTVYARATDIAGHTTEISETVTVDVLPPEAVTLTLTGNGSPLAPGEILPTAAANFVLTWDASSDGSGLDDYQVRWTTQVTDTISAEFTHTVPTTGPLTSVYAAVDGQKVSVELGSRDTLGNQRWQSFGSVFVDSQLALDYIAMNVGDEGMYRGWMESDCTDLGIDRRANRIYGNIPAQELFASWNAGALRLAWIGGNWYADGDLFLYLDTAAGGTNQVYDPFGATYDITLPDGMLADYLVWVQDGETASLLHWEGGWVVASDQLPVSSFQFSVVSGWRLRICICL
ncbi:MAG: LamG-like jellyroll fold domain-containing protein [Chloroflexota bacterium]